MSYKKDEFKILANVSLVEFAERYSFYIIQSLLILFLVDKYGLDIKLSSSFVGTVIAFVYASSLVGGIVADKFIGYYKTAFLGGVILTVGMFILAIQSNLYLMKISLALVCLASGLIKSNMSSFLGIFYTANKSTSASRSFGFSLFYSGINSGGLFALIFAGYLSSYYGYNVAFYSALIASLIMLISFFTGFKVNIKYIVNQKINFKQIVYIILILLTYSLLVFISLSYSLVSDIIIYIVLSAIIIYLIYSYITLWSKLRVFIISCIFILSILFWSIYFQLFISILIIIKNAFNNHIYSFVIEPSQYIVIDAVIVILFSVIIGYIWEYLYIKNILRYDISKLCIGFVMVGLFVLSFFIGASLSYDKIHMFYILLAMIFLGLSEVFFLRNFFIVNIIYFTKG